MGHVTVRISRFESLGNSIDKIACKNVHIIELAFFFQNSIYSVCNSIGIYWQNDVVGIYLSNYR
jgi:hypothetical protein